jgi:hypothetical protein
MNGDVEGAKLDALNLRHGAGKTSLQQQLSVIIRVSQPHHLKLDIDATFLSSYHVPHCIAHTAAIPIGSS